MSEIFRPHGEFRSRIEGRIVITEVTGPWNRELVEAWARHVYPDVKKLAESGPHVGLAIVRKSMLCPPDALEALARVARYAVKHLHCIGEFIIADAGVEGRGLVERPFERIYEGVVPFRFFETYEEAKAHADALLRDHDAAQGKPPEDINA